MKIKFHLSILWSSGCIQIGSFQKCSSGITTFQFSTVEVWHPLPFVEVQRITQNEHQRRDYARFLEDLKTSD